MITNMKFIGTIVEGHGNCENLQKYEGAHLFTVTICYGELDELKYKDYFTIVPNGKNLDSKSINKYKVSPSEGLKIMANYNLIKTIYI